MISRIRLPYIPKNLRRSFLVEIIQEYLASFSGYFDKTELGSYMYMLKRCFAKNPEPPQASPLTAEGPVDESHRGFVPKADQAGYTRSIW